MVTTSHESHATGQRDSAWKMPTMLDFDASSAEAHTEQWLDLVDWTPDAGRHRHAPAPLEVAEVREREHIEIATSQSPSACTDAPVETHATVPRSLSAAKCFEPKAPAEQLEGVESGEVVEPRTVVATTPEVDSVPQATRVPEDASVDAPVPDEQAVMVAEDQALAELRSLALQTWPANRSIAPYLSRVEALQLALVIARLERTQGEDLRRREQRRLRRTVGLVAIGSAVSVLVLALASQFDLPARADRVEPSPVVAQGRVVSPIGASVRFLPEPVADVTTHPEDVVQAPTPKARAVARKSAHRK